MNPIKFHTPVLVNQVLTYLIGNPSGIYVDGTLGGAGHSFEILKKLTRDGMLVGIDEDEQAIAQANQCLQPYQDQVQLKHGNFAQMATILNSLSIDRVDGVLLDLGLSSYQIDAGERGFSYLTSGPLDMRRSTQIEITAKEIVNTFPETKLEQIFKDFGEEKRARYIARAMVRERERIELRTTEQIVAIIESVVPFPKRIKSLARIFQALRIVVNKELENLQLFLNQSVDLLKPGGRIVIIAYHSLEDRLVKDFFSQQVNPCECPPGLPLCLCGKQAQIRLLTKKVIKPMVEEIKANPRSRSARLRAIEKL